MCLCVCVMQFKAILNQSPSHLSVNIMELCFDIIGDDNNRNLNQLMSIDYISDWLYIYYYIYIVDS